MLISLKFCLLKCNKVPCPKFSNMQQKGSLDDLYIYIYKLYLHLEKKSLQTEERFYAVFTNLIICFQKEVSTKKIMKFRSYFFLFVVFPLVVLWKT